MGSLKAASGKVVGQLSVKVGVLGYLIRAQGGGEGDPILARSVKRPAVNDSRPSPLQKSVDPFATVLTCSSDCPRL